MKNPLRARSRIAVVALALAAAFAAGTVAATAAQPPAGGSPAEATAGCGTAPSLESGSHTIQSGGVDRSFILRVPDDYDNSRAYPLIFAFHWWGGTANDVASGGSDGEPWAYYGLQRLSDNSAIFVAPQGIDNAWPNNGGRDTAFVDDMIALLDAGLCVDTEQRFALGFSYGGGMSFALACERSGEFRAVAVYSGAQLSGCNGGTEPVAYMGIHGIGDTVLNISQGRSLRDRFVANNGCTPQTPPRAPAGSLTHITTEYAGCADGYPVVWSSFDGDHNPAPRDGAPGGGGDTWVPGESWDFITRFESTL